MSEENTMSAEEFYLDNRVKYLFDPTLTQSAGFIKMLEEYAQHVQRSKALSEMWNEENEEAQKKPVYAKGMYSANHTGVILKDGKKADIDELIDTLNAQHVKPKNLKDDEIEEYLLNKYGNLCVGTEADQQVFFIRVGMKAARDLIEVKQ